ncbi:hypothetical protein ACFFQF_16575 [Haladaptatus pallidirubidus]|uniref:hypothetical protein n=1 Tax=Haladaptatus pallidirubidus TaxID=1008152 RepID=UPI0035E8DE4B
MTTNQRRVTAVGFLGTLVILSGILYLVGIEDLLRVLSRADAGLVVLVGAVTVGWLAAWALGLRTVLAVLVYASRWFGRSSFSTGPCFRTM